MKASTLYTTIALLRRAASNPSALTKNQLRWELEGRIAHASLNFTVLIPETYCGARDLWDKTAVAFNRLVAIEEWNIDQRRQAGKLAGRFDEVLGSAPLLRFRRNHQRIVFHGHVHGAYSVGFFPFLTGSKPCTS
ncbi:hypothetical protein BDZ88DRAFT_426472 [Geranomyces variabilis]|nr:hypothetical protein BDZ88DRAFT_426472 [Geranomyces variabilis]